MKMDQVCVEEDVQVVLKKPYKVPAVVTYGSVGSLTQGGSGAAKEGVGEGGVMTKKPR